MENPNDQLQLAHLKGLLDQVREAAETFAAKEDAIERDYHLQLHRQREAEELGTTDHEEKLNQLIETAEEAQAQTLGTFSELAQERTDRIERGYLASKNRLSRSLAEQEGHRVYQLQMDMIQHKKDLVSKRETLQADREIQITEIARDRESLAKLRKAAIKALRGYGVFSRALGHPPDSPEPTGTATDLLTESREQRSVAGEVLKEFRGLALPRLFSSLPVSLSAILAALVAGGIAMGLPSAGIDPPVNYFIGAGVYGAGLMLILFLFAIGKSQGADSAKRLIEAIHRSRACLEKGDTQATSDYQAALAGLESNAEDSSQQFDQARKQSPEEAEAIRAGLEKKLDEQYARVKTRWDSLATARKATLIDAHERRIAHLQGDAESAVSQLVSERETNESRLNKAYNFNWDTLEKEWRETITPLYERIEAVKKYADELFPEWSRERLETWKAPRDFAHAARFGTLSVDLSALASALPASDRLPLPGPAQFKLPISLVMPQRGSVLFESNGGGREEMIGSLNQVILRFLSVAPPAKLSFTIIDPIGLGEDFSGLMHLADYDESLINSRIWTQGQQIEARLGDLNDHIEKVIQMYLRNEFANITDYNLQAGKIAEKYHFVVIADFPANFSETATKRLQSIAASGARCGVYLLMHWDRSKPAPQDFDPDTFRQHALRVVGKKNGKLLVDNQEIEGAPFSLDQLDDEALTNDLIHKLGAASRDAERIEVPFSDIAPPADGLWSESTTKELRVPIGRTGATKLQYLAIGRDTRQHALIAGKTGSGKSTLFHVMVTNLALWCSPDEVEFYLVDFKKGVEFKCYANARLPHAKVIAIESDREFGLSVLQRLDEELKRRGDLFRDLGVQDLPGYEKAGGAEPIPRTLLLIDEFQEFFVEDDRIAQTANVLLDRIVRQGRAFGIHVILGSQTLGGAYTLARTTLGQMVIRVALQCNEADAYLIMDDGNPAPRLLTRPGEGIYNDQAGMVEGNSPFQVVWLPDEERDQWLGKVTSQAAASGRQFAAPIVFEGNAPADIRENVPLQRALAAFPPEKTPAEVSLWLGAPNAIKGPTQAVFRRQSGNHLLIIGQREEAALSMLTVGMTGISAQYPAGKVRFVLLDSSAPDTTERDYLESVADKQAHPVTIARGHDLDAAMNDLAGELDRRSQDEAASATAPAIYLMINGLQRIKKLRYEEDFSFSLDDDSSGADPGTQLNTLITDGPALGIHVIAVCDTYNNLNRTLSRKALSEFEMRVLFQMSANDSASLIDSPKASGLGLHRALFYNEQEGYLETFRPYALPSEDWFDSKANPVSA